MLKNKLATLIGTWIFATLAIAAFYRLQSSIPFLGDYLGLITTGLLIYLPMLATWKSPHYIPLFEKDFSEFSSSFKNFLIFSAIIFIPIFLLNHAFQSGLFNTLLPDFMQRNFQLGAISPSNWRVIGASLIYQILLVALPEEFFFRGYMQTVLNEYFPKRRKLFGVEVGLSLIITSLVFAFSHSIIHIAWWHFSIFFPALAFGWLREKTGSLTASILFHALCNVFSLWVAMGYR